MTKNKVLIIGQVIPEPQSSAAGLRMLQLMELLLAEGYAITFATAARDHLHPMNLISMGIQSVRIDLNDPSFDLFLTKLDPQVVIFDRFMTEEQYGWRVIQQCPRAIRILDTEDLHCLRKERENAIKRGFDFQINQLISSTLAYREIASILRCDVTLVISSFEMKILKEVFKVPDNLLLYFPLLFPENSTENLPTFWQRKNFITIGNFFHPPNWDAVQIIKSKLWKPIKRQLPEAEMHIYGAYAGAKVQQLHNEQEGFLIKGWTEDALKTIQNYRVLLAPLRFGAGIKGKLLSAMEAGTSSITTTIGSEGIANPEEWNGAVTNDWDQFIQQAIRYYKDNVLWEQAQKRGQYILRQYFHPDKFHQVFIQMLISLRRNIEQHRKTNFIGNMLTHHRLNSTKYMSKWIEEKNKRLSSKEDLQKD